ncbi:MAG: hypothetical protein M3081_10075 [Gemmatimonadota bacterium]|nr:hypothetical protein [Gemmatimonadota bacterium]
MLAYLDSLCTALLERNNREIRRLMRHPLASALPRRVREEVLAVLRARPNSVMAPIHTLHFYHQTEQLVVEEPTAVPATPQLELPLRPSAMSRELDLTIARARVRRPA